MKIEICFLYKGVSYSQEPTVLDCRPARQPIELLKSSKDWVSRGVLIPLFYGTGLSKFEDNSTETISLQQGCLEFYDFRRCNNLRLS